MPNRQLPFLVDPRKTEEGFLWPESASRPPHLLGFSGKNLGQVGSGMTGGFMLGVLFVGGLIAAAQVLNWLTSEDLLGE